jgi:preprotein translocase subunit SecD
MAMDVNQILLLMAAIAAAGTLAGLAVGRRLLWQASLVVMILAFCAGRLLPPSETLKLGLDLGGGTSLLYEVSVPEGMNDEQAIQQTIETLKRRVDPEGLRNLEWHHETGNRIEVRMPRPSTEVQARREALNRIIDRIERGNISRQEVLNAISAPEARRAALYADLAAGLTADGNDDRRRHKRRAQNHHAGEDHT